MKWDTPLTQAILLRRYKRFLADIHINGEIITAHVPNTGSMTSCWGPEWKCALSKSDNPKRKMPYTLEFTHNGVTWIGVNTANANKLAHQWLKKQLIPELKGYKDIIPEKNIGKSRIDFFLDGHSTDPACYVEVKSVTLKLDGVAQFPDAVSERGQKHLEELMKLKKKGLRAVMLYIVQREDVEMMKPAHSIDSVYGKLLQQAYDAGVEILVYQCKLDINEIGFKRALPFELE